MGWTYLHEVTYGWADDPERALAKAEELGKKAVSLGDPLGHMLLMNVYDYQGQGEKALAEGEKGLASVPNSANLNILFAPVLNGFGRHEEALLRAKRAIRLNPHHQPWYYQILGWCYYRNDQLQEAVETYRLAPDVANKWMIIASIYSQLGREADARKAAQEVYRIAPDYSWDKYGYNFNIIPDKDFKERLFDAFEKVGLK
jgi:tetratricopeptide (TPR) repeat protein